MYQLDIDDEALRVMKTRAIQLQFEAEAAKGAYIKAVESYWEDWLVEEMGLDNIYQLKFPFQCQLGAEHVVVDKLFANGVGEPMIIFRVKTKSGKWGKTNNYQSLPCNITPIVNE